MAIPLVIVRPEGLLEVRAGPDIVALKPASPAEDSMRDARFRRPGRTLGITQKGLGHLSSLRQFHATSGPQAVVDRSPLGGVFDPGRKLAGPCEGRGRLLRALTSRVK
jgi:hypothetical protein